MSEELEYIIRKYTRRGTTVAIDMDTTGTLLKALEYLKDERAELKEKLADREWQQIDIVDDDFVYPEDFNGIPVYAKVYPKPDKEYELFIRDKPTPKELK